MRVGVEVGGTFTDLVAVEGGRVVVTKVPSTPRSPDIGAFEALTASGIDLARIEDLGHGSTVATNAVLERKGASVAFVATAGFRDLLFMQRHDRRNIYDLFYAKPAPPVRRKDCFEAYERMNADGSVQTPLDEVKVTAELVPALKAGGYRAVAVCLLNAYANPAHEQRLARLITQALPGVLVTCSHQVAREFREFERASTTLLSAYVQPVIDGYLHRFEHKLSGAGFKGRFTVMQSNGGRLPADAMRTSAITALYSGPAAGVVGATRQAARSGFRDLITFDMGGTSTDVCLVQDGKPSLASESEIDGLPIRTPVLDIVSVGAGGGSIAWVDDGGMLRAGPQSAGADPGPVCYGKGGTQPTVTDANVALGYLNPDYFLGGEVPLDRSAAERAIAERIAAPLGLDPLRAASGIVEIINVHMEQGIKAVSSERGHDLREFALVAFGGAGAVHAGRLAADLDIPRVIVPEHPGVTSALGLLMSDVKHDYVRSRLRPLADTPPADANQVLGELAERARADLRAEGFADEQVVLQYLLDLRYSGQGYELSVAAPAYPLDVAALAEVRRRFDALHERLHGHQAPEEPVEVVNYRVVAFARVPQAQLRRQPPATGEVAAARKGERLATFAELPASVLCPVYDRRLLGPGHVVVGPAIIEQVDSTIVVYPGQEAVVDDYRNVIIHVAPAT